MATFFKFNPEQQRKEGANQRDLFIHPAVPRDNIFRPKEGTHRVRLLPPWSERGIIMLKVPMYWQRGLSQMTFISPHYFQEGSCPFFRAYQDLLPRYQEFRNNEDWMFDYNNSRPTMAWFANVVCLQEMHKGVQIWRIGKEVQGMIQGILDGGEYGDISDPEQGVDLTLTVSGSGNRASAVVYPTRQSTPLANMAWLESIFNLDRVLMAPDPADVAAAFASIPWRHYGPGVVASNGLHQRTVAQTGVASTRVGGAQAPAYAAATMRLAGLTTSGAVAPLPDDIPLQWPTTPMTAAAPPPEASPSPLAELRAVPPNAAPPNAAPPPVTPPVSPDASPQSASPAVPPTGTPAREASPNTDTLARASVLQAEIRARLQPGGARG